MDLKQKIHDMQLALVLDAPRLVIMIFRKIAVVKCPQVQGSVLRLGNHRNQDHTPNVGLFTYCSFPRNAWLH